MEINRFRIFTKSRSDVITITPVGDVHLGSNNCDKAYFLDTINEVRITPNNYWIGMGDLMECIPYTDKRFDPRSIDPDYAVEKDKKGNIKKYLTLDDSTTAQYLDLKKWLKPIAHKCLGLHTGNHEEKLRLTHHRDITRDLCRELKIPYLGYTAFTKLSCECRNQKGRVHSNDFSIFSTHGWVYSRTPGAKINRLESLSGYFVADIYLMAHGHRKLTLSMTQLGLGNKGHELSLVSFDKVAGMTGSFLKGYEPTTSSYVERKGFPPVSMGTIKLTIKPDVRQIRISE